jgi:hypothetical protein
MGRDSSSTSREVKVMEITEEWRLEKVIDLFPETMRVLYGIGFTDLESPVMRHAAKLVSVREAAGLMGADVYRLVESLNRCIQGNYT